MSPDQMDNEDASPVFDARTLAHDLRSPLAVMTSYLAFQNKQELDDKQKQYLQALAQATERLKLIIDHLQKAP